MREQRGINATTFKRRASLPPEELAASYHRVGTRAGLHPEDTPYITYGKPLGRTSVTNRRVYDVAEDDREYDTLVPTSTRRYQPQAWTEGDTRYEFRPTVVQTPKRQKRNIHTDSDELVTTPLPHKSSHHWLLYVGLGMLAMIALFAAGSLALSWLDTKIDDMTYGYPRTFQINAYVGHNESRGNPSHFIAINLNRHVEIIEFPGGDPTKARVYLGPTLVGDNQDLTPVTLTFRDVNGDGKPDLLIHIQDQTLVMINTGSGFRPPTQTDHIGL